jgi:exopolysaccharide biosynthesis polyprenyl glycosylphosphotransferase
VIRTQFVSAANGAPVPAATPAPWPTEVVVDERTRAILAHRRRAAARRRGWLVRRALLAADMVALSLAFVATHLLFGAVVNRFGDSWLGYAAFACTLPLWVVVAKVYGLYDRDEERTGHVTVDDAVGVFHMLTVGVWVLFAGSWMTGLARPDVYKVTFFWALSFSFVTLARSAARAWCRGSLSYLQNTIVVGAGDVGQLIVRKFLQHPEYGINVVGFVDADPRERRSDLDGVPLLGPPEQLPALVRLLDVERVIVAFSGLRDREALPLLRSLKGRGVQVDVVPRLFELVGPRTGVHAVEALPLIGLPPPRLSRSSLLLKRAIDLVGATIGLVFAAPFFAVVAWWIKHDSPGPVFFRQVRLGMNMREFEALKFRTMHVGTSAAEHEVYIGHTMSAKAAPETNGLYKLDRDEAITRVGRWLRATSLDELPQLLNVLRGQMSLVGPRPCIPYETKYFAPHHFDRFDVPAGITGLWQVTARAHSTFGEALDLDVAYARGWSLGLDLRLLLRTPLQLVHQRKGTR